MKLTVEEYYKNQIEDISYKECCLTDIRGVEDALEEPIYSKDELMTFAESYHQAKMKEIMPSEKLIKKAFNDFRQKSKSMQYIVGGGNPNSNGTKKKYIVTDVNKWIKENLNR